MFRHLVLFCALSVAAPALANEPCPPVQKPQKVESATWFNGANKADVTAKVRELVAAGTYRFEARNHILGADPAQGVQKQLTVVFADAGGKSATITVTERDFFEFPVAKVPVREVTSATWFNGARKADVTAKVREFATTGQYRFEARNHILGADPAAGVQKQLTVVYTNGSCEPVTKTVTERQFFEF